VDCGEDGGSLSVVDDDVGDEDYKAVYPNLKEWYDHIHLRTSLGHPSYYYCSLMVDPSSEPCGNAPHLQPFPFASLTFGRI